MQLKQYYGFDSLVNDGAVGVEVEMEGEYLPERVYNWSVTRDPSLRGNSFEYVLSQPSSRATVDEKIVALYKKFYQAGFKIKPSDRCGVHIHLNMREHTIEEIFNIIILYLIFEEVLIHWCGEEREGNLFCLRAKDAEWFIYELIKSRKEGFFTGQLMNKEYSKYAALGLHTLGKYGSLEFRSMGAPKHVEPILTWLHTLLKIKDWAVTEKDPVAFIGQCSQLGPLPFMRNVFGEHFKDFSTPGMSEMIMSGIRKAQAVAYCPLGELKVKARPLPRYPGEDDFDRLVRPLLANQPPKPLILPNLEPIAPIEEPVDDWPIIEDDNDPGDDA